MTWAALLLADPSPCLRRLALIEIMGRPADDPEVRELAGLHMADPLVAELLSLQAADGSWPSAPPLAPAGGQELRATSLALARLGYLGLGSEQAAVRRGAEYLFSQQQPDGSWPLVAASAEFKGEEGLTSAPLQTAFPLMGLATAGYAADPRAERAYEWLLAQRLPDGAWPTGWVAGSLRRVGGYRRLPHSRWGCRSNTTAALVCLAHHGERRRSPEAQRALDHLLARETREAHTLGFEVARLLGLEPARGFLTYYARFDLALVLDLAWRVGATLDDARLRGAVEFVRGLQGPYGLWACAAQPQAARWLTFDLLRSLSRLQAEGEWVSLEPPTPFSAYPRRPRRY